MNCINLIGNFTKDPELMSTKNGSSVCMFALAFDKIKKGGEKETQYIECVVYDKLAETIVKFCRKGHKLGVTGTLNCTLYTDDTGKKRKNFQITVNSVSFLTKKADADNPTRIETVNDISTTPINDDDLPF